MTPMTKNYLLMAILMLVPGLTLTLPGCAVCKSSDSPEVCRTKERNHNQPRVEYRHGLF